jgi:outer membrane protein assembly factor BamD
MSYSDFQRLHPRHVRLDYAVYRHGSAALQKASRVADRDQTWTQQAVNTWSNFSQRFPESAHREEVEELLDESRERLAHKEFRIGRFYYKREAWGAAMGRLEGMVQRYPQSPDLPRALAMMAVCAERMGEIGRAAELAERMVRDHPEAVRARQHLRRRSPGLLKPQEETSE